MEELQKKFGELLDTSPKLFKNGAVCDQCLGRAIYSQYNDLLEGIGNRKRGEEVRKFLIRNKAHKASGASLSLDVLEKKGSGDCWLCQGLFDRVEEFAEKCIEASKEYEYSTFLVGTRLNRELVEAEESLKNQLKVESGESMRADLNRSVGKKISELTAKKADFDYPDMIFGIDLTTEKISLNVRSVYIYGRYNKLIRGIPQTRWRCRKCKGKGCERCNYTGKMYPESVEEIVAKPFIEEMKGEKERFHGAGREDIDVRMLGNGRPFVLEIVRPLKRKANLTKIEGNINSSNKVSVSNLRFTDGREVERIKAMDANKEYRSMVEFGGVVDKNELERIAHKLSGTVIDQRTPTRVLHRRANKLRKRKILSFVVEEFGGNCATIKIECESGTYIKEFLHGDEGRTRPSLAELLGVSVEVESLDVTDFFEIDRSVEELRRKVF
jgi:tRNA pseudouridine synthase 10